MYSAHGVDTSHLTPVFLGLKTKLQQCLHLLLERVLVFFVTCLFRTVVMTRGVAGICASFYSATTAIGAVQWPILKAFAVTPYLSRVSRCDWVQFRILFMTRKRHTCMRKAVWLAFGLVALAAISGSAQEATSSDSTSNSQTDISVRLRFRYSPVSARY